MDREEFLQQAGKFPSRRTDREVLGWSWAVLHDGASFEEASCFVWPETCQGEATEDIRLPDVYKWRGNFLAFPGFEMAFMSPAWSVEKRERFVQAYRDAGLTHLPLSPWASYGGVTYDYSQRPEAFNDLIGWYQARGVLVCVMMYTDAFKPWHPKSQLAANRWADGYVPKLTNIKLASTGWEFNQINGSEWTGDGTKHIEWAKRIKALLPAQVPLYVHFSPERITGWPNYPDHSGPQDEAGWWTAAAPYVDGLLYQRAFDEPLSELKAHTIGGIGKDGSLDVGDSRRIAGGRWGVRKHFVLFEHSRNVDRWQQVVETVKNDPLIDGWC